MFPTGQSTMDAIPSELLGRIVQYLCPGDLQELRQTCKVFLNAVDPCLFRQVSISKLQHHKDRFDHVSQSQCLAPLVKEVVWLEFPLAPIAQEWAKPLLEDFDLSKKAASLHDQLLATSWLPSDTAKCVCDRRGPFIDALRRMPNVAVFTAKPMQTHHIKHIVGPDEPIELPRLILSGPRNWNEGLFRFLLPAMDWPGSTIDRLVWQAEAAHWETPSFVLVPGAFHNLSTVHLSVNWEFLLAKEIRVSLGHCLAAATGLRTISLEFPAYLPPWLQHHISDVFSQICGNSQWKNLNSFHSVNLEIPDEKLISFVKRHADTLIHLQIEGFLLEHGIVDLLSSFPRLHIVNRKMTQGCQKDAEMVARERELLQRFFELELEEPDGIEDPENAGDPEEVQA